MGCVDERAEERWRLPSEPLKDGPFNLGFGASDAHRYVTAPIVFQVKRPHPSAVEHRGAASCMTMGVLRRPSVSKACLSHVPCQNMRRARGGCRQRQTVHPPSQSTFCCSPVVSDLYAQGVRRICGAKASTS